jgi:NADP-dependent 3-hydroxy acid dehydrogenase YdfG
MVGGTCRTALNVARELKENNYSIDVMTYRHEENIPSEKNISESWEYLDLFNKESVDIFLKNQASKKYDKIIFYISNSAKPYGESINYDTEDLNRFYGVFCVNYIVLMNNLVDNLSDDGAMIFISSSASDTGANDPVYASGKALIQSYILSLNYFLNDNQSAYFISPKAIAGSKFYESLSDDIKLNIPSLAYPKDMARVIIESKIHKGKRVKMGWDKPWQR